MNKTKITVEITLKRKSQRSTSKFDKLINSFMRLIDNLSRRDKAELSRLIVIAFSLVLQTYLLLTFVLNRP
jgi:hypothetical protein